MLGGALRLLNIGKLSLGGTSLRAIRGFLFGGKQARNSPQFGSRERRAEVNRLEA